MSDNQPLFPLGTAGTIGCPWNSSFYWSESHVTPTALHNLTIVCPFAVDKNLTEFEHTLENPATFFVQVARLVLALLLFLLVSLIYNSITVLGRTVLSVAMCSLYWIIMLLLMAIKAMVFIVLVPCISRTGSFEHDDEINEAGFVSLVLLQCIADLMLLLALDHEQRFRSSDYAILDSSPYSQTCVPITVRRFLCSWYRLAAIATVLVPLLLVAVVEIIFQVNLEAPAPLVWVFIASLYLPRACAVVFIVRIFLLDGLLRPTILAKLFLVAGFLFSLVDHLPSSVTSVAPYAHHRSPPQHCNSPCQLSYMTVFDLFQLLGGVSVIFYTLFVRSQYLRIESECKLAVVWDMQRLLNINGRSLDEESATV